MPVKGRGQIVNQNQIAEIFGYSTQTVRRWRTEGLVPHQEGKNGQAILYNTADVAEWLKERAVLGLSDSPSENETLDQSNKRLAAAKADLAEMERAERRAELIPVELAAKAYQEGCDVIRSNLLTLPGEVSSDLVGLEQGEIEEVLNNRFLDLMDALASDILPALETEVSDGQIEIAETTAEAESH